MAPGDFGAVIMAAGESRRMGMPKLALPFGRGKTFVGQCVDVLASFGCGEVVVVVNPSGKSWMEKQPAGWSGTVRTATNPFPGKGRFLSLQAGFQALGVPMPVFICNVDSPFFGVPILALLASQLQGADYVRPVFRGMPGHPVLVSARVVNDVLQRGYPAGINVRTYLSGYPAKNVPVDDPAVLANINTPDDFRLWFSFGPDTVERSG